ncbi:hypothetical protein Acr_00g0050610 [Actinidia rufa]|uniref:Uncharacterized protein n=1 Tax=Actinidia rufa TaxID=165716 RepID=A0A7J0DKJ2_9ERIC|nr:hypothetical protein Acr_00g0050610 [Actinidia rufa]
MRRAQCEYYSTPTLIGWRSPPAATTERAWRSSALELGTIATLTVLEAWTKATIGNNHKGCPRAKCYLHVRAPSNCSYALMKTSTVDDELLAMP